MVNFKCLTQYFPLAYSNTHMSDAVLLTGKLQSSFKAFLTGKFFYSYVWKVFHTRKLKSSFIAQMSNVVFLTGKFQYLKCLTHCFSFMNFSRVVNFSVEMSNTVFLTGKFQYLYVWKVFFPRKLQSSFSMQMPNTVFLTGKFYYSNAWHSVSRWQIPIFKCLTQYFSLVNFRRLVFKCLTQCFPLANSNTQISDTVFLIHELQSSSKFQYWNA